MEALRTDQRILDFCGEDVDAGWIISKRTQPGENWIKYDFNIKGQSGKLQTTIIGDYLEHKDLLELEKERVQYFEQGAKDEDYIPTDFDSYSVPS